MGIKNLNKFLKQYTKNGIKEININKYQNKIICIDTSIFLYKFLYSGNYINNFINQILKLWNYNIHPVYIFDGKPSSSKNNILDKRKNIKNNKKNKVLKLHDDNNILISNFVGENKNFIDENKNIISEDLINKIEKNNQEINKIKKTIIEVTNEHIINLKKLFDCLGIKYIHSKTESDILCSELINDNIVDACLSEDMDFLTHNCQYLLRNLNYHNDNCVEYYLPDILNDLKLNLDEFIDLCILMGCDYTIKIKGIGPINAYKLITKYRNIENILENNTHLNIDNNFNYNNAREMFKNKNKCNYTRNDLKCTNINYNELTEILNKHKIKNIDNLIVKIKKLEFLDNSNTIDNFFKKIS